MIKTSLFTLSLAALLSSCIVVRNDYGYVNFTWELQTNGSPVGCNPGETVSVIGPGARYDFSCLDYGGVSGSFPAGNQTFTIQFNPTDGSAPVALSTSQYVYSGGTTDLGHFIFPVIATNGSATVTWSIHQNSLGAPGVRCIAGDLITFQIDSKPAFDTDCFLYDSQPITDLPPGSHTISASLYSNRVLIDSAPSQTFTVGPGADTSIRFDFIVATPGRDAGGRSDDDNARPAAPEVKYLPSAN